MLGAIIGDIVGSIFEKSGKKSTKFDFFTKESHFTDDTVLTIATAEVLLYNQISYPEAYKLYGNQYPNRGYGRGFQMWLDSPLYDPYQSYGNGSAMRVVPIGWAFDELYEVLAEAKKSAEATHDHPEGIKGAQAVASCVYLAKNKISKPEIREYIRTNFGYDVYRTIEDIRPSYNFSSMCQYSVPEAIIAFLDSDNFENAIRLAVSLGGDADTQAAIAGGIAHAFYGKINEDVEYIGLQKIPKKFREIYKEFKEVFNVI
jgi:ADP-ribosylglycohydrolase